MTRPLTQGWRWLIVGGLAVAVMGATIWLLVVVLTPSIVPRAADQAELIGVWREPDTGASIAFAVNGTAEVSSFSFYDSDGDARPTVDATGEWSTDPAAATAVGVLLTDAPGGRSWIDLDYATCRGEPCLRYGPEENALSFFREQ